VAVHELERWRRIFLESGMNGFKRRDTPGAERALKRVRAKVGELTMKPEIVEWFLNKRLRGGAEEVDALRGSCQSLGLTLVETDARADFGVRFLV
jgi:hypothetical protein